MPLFSRMAMAPLFAIALSEMISLHLVGYTAPFWSFRSLIGGGSWGLMFDMMQVVTMGDFTDRQDVISRFTFIAVFDGVFWAALVLPNIRLQSVQKQTHFQTVEDYQQAVESFQFPRTELWLAGLMFAIAYLSMAFGSAVLGVVFMLLVPIMLGRNVNWTRSPNWYSPVRTMVVGISAGAAVYLGLN